MMVQPFVMPDVCYVGKGALGKLKDELGSRRVRHAIVVCDPGILQAGIVDRVKEVLRETDISFDVYSEVELEPSADEVEKVGKMIRTGNYELIIGVGGGSSLDVAKGAAVLATNEGRVKDYIGTDCIPKPGIPTVLIPTTSGTGAEVTLNAIFALKDEQVKKGIVSRYLRAKIAIVDPELTLSCPPKATAAAGMDALVHAIESYTAKRATLQTDIYALKAVELIARSLRRAVYAGDDIEARTEMSYGSFFAGVSLANAGVGAVHALAYPLGGRFGVPHGIANALLLPYVLEYNVVAHIEKFATLSEAFGGSLTGKPLEKAESMIESVRKLSRDIGIPQKLRDVGVKAEDLEVLTKGAVEQTRLLNNNPRVLTEEDIRQIYANAL